MLPCLVKSSSWYDCFNRVRVQRCEECHPTTCTEPAKKLHILATTNSLDIPMERLIPRQRWRNGSFRFQEARTFLRFVRRIRGLGGRPPIREENHGQNTKRKEDCTCEAAQAEKTWRNKQSCSSQAASALDS